MCYNDSKTIIIIALYYIMMYCVYVHENKTLAVQFFPPLVHWLPSLQGSAPDLSNFYCGETERLQSIIRINNNEEIRGPMQDL